MSGFCDIGLLVESDILCRVRTSLALKPSKAESEGTRAAKALRNEDNLPFSAKPNDKSAELFALHKASAHRQADRHLV